MIRPDYYDQFQCIADKCRHTCCAGWEIDIDEKTLEKYKKMKGRMGQKLQENIVVGETPHFRLGEKERCPFLNSCNLCEIILECGKDYLCQICSDHPRFRNVLCGKEEIGIGLCCEAAAKLILGKKEKTVFIGKEEIKEAGENPLERKIFQARETAFSIIQNRTISMEERAEQVLEKFQVRMPEKTETEWAGFYSSLERMDDSWTGELEKLKRDLKEERSLPHLEIPFEQFFVYLLYRHLPQAQDDMDIKVQIGYVYQNYKLLRMLCIRKEEETGCSLLDLMELARLFSSEIEYSEENTDAILDLIWEENAF